MFQQVFTNYFKIAESAIQFQHELLRQWSGQWPMAPFADGHTEQVRAMQKKASEDSSEMLNLQHKLLAMVAKPENRLIEDLPRMAKATALPGLHGDVDAQTAVPGGATTAPNGLPGIAGVAARTFRTGEDATIVLREEELHAHKRLVETGEVRVRKEVVTEHRTIEVPVHREELVIERHAPSGACASATELGPGEEIRIALREERVSLEKRPVVREEVTVGKRMVQETERVGGEVRKEEMRVVRVEREQDVDMHAAPSWDAIIADGEESSVRHQAYLKWLEEGCPEGQDRRHYFEALKQVQ